MPEDNIDLSAVIEQLQHENERLRETLSRIKVHIISWETISQAVLRLVSDVRYILGLCTGIFLMIVGYILFEVRA